MSERYDYKYSIYQDIQDYILENEEYIYQDIKDCEDIYDIQEVLYEKFFTEDAITGNASGSYTFSTWKAEENICHNLDIIQDMIDEGYIDKDRIFEAEYLDVSIRCYYLGEVLQEYLDENSEVIEEIKNKYKENENEDN